jgi:hypothetical protein
VPRRRVGNAEGADLEAVGVVPAGEQEAVNRYLDCGIFACGVSGSLEMDRP